MAGSDQLLNILSKIDNQFSSIMLFSHNPGLTDFTNHLLNKSIDNIPTCGIVAINSKIETWDELESNNCDMAAFEYPKKYFK